jgi:hypothetical protein
MFYKLLLIYFSWNFSVKSASPEKENKEQQEARWLKEFNDTVEKMEQKICEKQFQKNKDNIASNIIEELEDESIYESLEESSLSLESKLEDLSFIIEELKPLFEFNILALCKPANKNIFNIEMVAEPIDKYKYMNSYHSSILSNILTDKKEILRIKKNHFFSETTLVTLPLQWLIINHLRNIQVSMDYQLIILKITNSDLIDTIFLSFVEFRFLRYLDLSDNKFKAITQFRLDRLEVLHICNNQYEDKMDINALRNSSIDNLEEINLYGSKITQLLLPPTSNLYILNLACTDIENINALKYHEGLRYNLKEINISYNKITNLNIFTDFSYPWENLVSIHASSNDLTETTNIFNIKITPSLETIDVSIINFNENQKPNLKFIEESFITFKEIICTHNYTDTLCVSKVTGCLEKLNMERHILYSLDSLSGYNFYSLVDLNLSYGKIESLCTFYPIILRNLKILNLSNNNIKATKGEKKFYLNAPLLIMLYIENNPITSYWKKYDKHIGGFIANMKHLKKLRLQNGVLLTNMEIKRRFFKFVNKPSKI